MDNLPTASGIDYDDAHDLVETIVSIKRNKYNFPGHDSEDLAQDIRIICWDSLAKFDPEKLGKSVFHFVARCVDNALYNKFRGVYLDNNPPCLRCEHYIKDIKKCAIEEQGCDRIRQYRNRMAQKRAIASPLSYNNNVDKDDDGDFTQQKSLSAGSLTGVCDLDDFLRSNLDDSLINAYDLMIDGKDHEVPDSIKRDVRRQVKDILEENGDVA
jgi:hypothetical protein